MDEISKVLDEAFNGDIQEPEREKVTTDELRAAYCKAAELKGPATGMTCLGVLFEPFHDITIWRDENGGFWYSSYYVGDQEENDMKIKRDLGHLEGHWLVEIYELEDGRCICVNRDTSNGETMTAWWKDSDEPEFEVKEILEPCSFDDDGEPLQYDLIGFEEVY